MKYHVYIQRGFSGRGEQVNAKPYHRLETARASLPFWRSEERKRRSGFKSPEMRAIGGAYVVRESPSGIRCAVTHYETV